jgi:hypothetical protein
MTGRSDDPVLEQIQAELDEDGVHVAPGMEQYVDAADVAALEATVAGSDVPLQVVVHPFTYDDQFGGRPEDLLSKLHDASGQHGVFLANSAVYEPGDFGIVARIWDSPQAPATFDGWLLTDIAEAEGRDDLGAQLVAAAEAVAEGTVQQRWSELQESTSDAGGDGGDAAPSSSGGSDGSAGPVLVTLLVVAVLAVLVGLVVVRRRRVGTPPGEQPASTYALPASVLERVQDAHDQVLTRRAAQAVLELGESIDAAEIGPDGDRSSWQAALDHYDLGRRVLGEDDEADVLDVVGALVLAERGRRALDAAVRGQRFQPTPPCYLNPLHGAAQTAAAVTVRGDSVDVPLCRDCRTALRKGRRPDVLDVLHQGRAVHYFETGHEPWASTGYGALDPDLVGRLHRRR